MKTDYDIKLDMARWRRGDEAPGWSEREINECLVAYARNAIAERMRQHMTQGQATDWWKEYARGISDIRHDLMNAMQAGSAIDVLVYAAMIYVREAADGPGQAADGPGDRK